MTVERVVSETARGVTKGVTDAVRKIWSVMDAAVEKPAPSQYLSHKAIRAIQGAGAGVQRLGTQVPDRN